MHTRAHAHDISHALLVFCLHALLNSHDTLQNGDGYISKEEFDHFVERKRAVWYF